MRRTGRIVCRPWREALLVTAMLVAGANAACDEQDAKPEGEAEPPASLAHWTTGNRYIYKLASSTDITVDGQGRFMQLEVTGRWHVDVMQATADGAALLVGIGNANVTTDMAGKAGAFDAIAGELAGPFIAQLDADGRSAALRFPQGTNGLVVGLFRSLVSAVQGARPAPQQGAEIWTAEEHDNTGTYRAVYERKDDRIVQRTKEAYVKLASRRMPLPKGFSASAEIQHAHAQLRFDDRGRLAALSSDERVTISGTNVPPTRSTFQLELELLRVAEAPAELPDGTDAWVTLDAAEAYIDDNQSGINAARAGDYTLDRVLADLQALGKPSGRDDPNQRKRARLFAALKGIFASDAEATTRALELVENDSPLAEYLVQALRASKDPAIQLALLEILKDERDDVPLAASVLRSLSLVERPALETTQTLIELMDDPVFGTQATYGVGIHVRHHRGLGREKKARELLDMLLRRLKAAKSQTKLETVLRGIANASHPAAVASVEPYLEDRRPGVRRAAVQALTNVRSSEVEPLVVRALRDRSRRVRREAVDIAANHELSGKLSKQLKRIAKSDEDEHVRYAAVDLLGKELEQNPALRPILQWVAEHDEEEQHRALAAKYLNSMENL